MRRTYNGKLSDKSNRQLSMRARTVRLQKIMIVMISIILISVAILLGTGISAFASSDTQQPIYKYYTSIRVESGDTLWSIADTYADETQISKTDYISEVCCLNQLQNQQIHAGEYLVIGYYSTEKK